MHTKAPRERVAVKRSNSTTNAAASTSTSAATSAAVEAEVVRPASPPTRSSTARHDPLWVRILLIGGALAVVGVLIVVPVVSVFVQAFADGWSAYWKYLTENPDTTHAILLTLTVAPIAVCCNVVFGVAAAWAIARFRFPGRTILTAMIDLPFAVSPVVAGLMLLLIFGMQGLVGPWLREHDIKVAFALPGIILATTFVTLPFVARELLPVMEAIGSEEEVAAVSLGANAWQLFWRVTVPNIKWGLLYGIILCNARAMGEFGAVYVVSGRIAGQTDTMPLHVEKLHQAGTAAGNTASYAVASLLTFLALITLAIKVVLERKNRRELAEAAELRNVGGEA
jgi:sulfate transport system permease protein